MAQIPDLLSWLLPPNSEHVFALNPTEIKFSFSVCLACPSLGVKEDSPVGEGLKSRAAYNQWLGDSPGSKDAHILDSFLSFIPTEIPPWKIIVSEFHLFSKTQDRQHSVLKEKVQNLPIQSLLLSCFLSFRFPLGSLHLNCRHQDPEPHSIQISAWSHPQILLLHITQFWLKYYLWIFPHFSFLLKIFSVTGSAEGSTTNMAPFIFSLAKCFEIRDVYQQSPSKGSRIKSSLT